MFRISSGPYDDYGVCDFLNECIGENTILNLRCCLDLQNFELIHYAVMLKVRSLTYCLR